MKSPLPALVALVILGTTGIAAQGPTLVLEGGTLIDGTGKPAVADAVVLVQADRIKMPRRPTQPARP